jgi:pullulanase/glycogen debranching enzyme
MGRPSRRADGFRFDLASILSRDASLESPDDIVPWQTAPLVKDAKYRVGDRSVVMRYATGKG